MAKIWFSVRYSLRPQSDTVIVSDKVKRTITCLDVARGSVVSVIDTNVKAPWA